MDVFTWLEWNFDESIFWALNSDCRAFRCKQAVGFLYSTPFSLHFNISCSPLQGSRTYLEKKIDEFSSCNLAELIQHGLRSLDSCIQDGELDATNCTIAFVGKDTPFTIVENDDLQPHIDVLKDTEGPAEPAPETVDVDVAESGDGTGAAENDAMEEG